VKKLGRKKSGPPVVEIDDSPRIIKIEKMPMGVSVIKINFPFTLRHLAQHDITRAWILAQTEKSIMTVVGKKTTQIKKIKEECLEILYKDHPSLPKKGLNVKIAYALSFGQNPRGKFLGSFKWIGNLPALVRDLDDCGFSDIPLLAFVIPLDEHSPITEWVQFTRKTEGFVAIAIGNKLYNRYKLSDLKKILQESQTLQKLRAYICQIHKLTKESYTCLAYEE